MLDFQQISALSMMVLLVAGLLWLQNSRADQIVRDWAEATGVELISAEKRYVRTGPFFLNHARGQFVFRITVRDQAGAERAGWIRVGGWLAGMLSDKTKVIWDS
jgi:acetamidase/formamidase